MLQVRLSRVDLRQILARKKDALYRNHQSLTSDMKARLQRERGRVELAAGRMNALSPLAILERGYAICRDQQGTILKDAGSVSAGKAVNVRLARGELGCRVELIRSGPPDSAG
jgi:exodeoxyribonuclease VII large subunit